MKKIYTFILSIALLWGCAGANNNDEKGWNAPVSVDGGFVTMTDSTEADSEVEAMILPYKEKLDAQMNGVIGHFSGPFTKGGRGGSLGNMVTDAMLYGLKKNTGIEADFAVTNTGGLRVDLPVGDILLRHAYELMPFDNILVVLTFSPAEMDSLIHQISGMNGTPMAGISMTIGEDGNPYEVIINGKTWDRTKTYTGISIDYLANGNGRMRALWTASREDTQHFLRDAIAEYITDMCAGGQKMVPNSESRVRIAPN